MVFLGPFANLDSEVLVFRKISLKNSKCKKAHARNFVKIRYFMTNVISKGDVLF